MLEKLLLEIFNYKRKEPDYPLHNLHAYPCKFPAFIPREIVKNFARKGDIICDPFTGSGTTMLEATLLGYSSIGNDINPLFCLLSKVKAKPLGKQELNFLDKFLLSFLNEFRGFEETDIFSYKAIKHWFQENVIRELSFIKRKILNVENEDVRDLLLIILSSIIVQVSNQESDTRYAAINKNVKNLDTIKIFINKTKEIKKLYQDFYEKTKNFKIAINVHNLDGRNLKGIGDNSVDLIITSPPYANTYDYYLYHKHRNYWLNMDVRFAQYNEIGSRREFSSLRESSEKWKEDIKKCLVEMKRIIKKNRYIFIIIGDSVINKNLIKMNKMIGELSKDIKLKYIDVASCPLARHSKIFNPKFSSRLKKEEHLILLKK